MSAAQAVTVLNVVGVMLVIALIALAVLFTTGVRSLERRLPEQDHDLWTSYSLDVAPSSPFAVIRTNFRIPQFIRTRHYSASTDPGIVALGDRLRHVLWVLQVALLIGLIVVTVASFISWNEFGLRQSVRPDMFAGRPLEAWSECTGLRPARLTVRTALDPRPSQRLIGGRRKCSVSQRSSV
jgi:hypothetical protein